jgi:hypothetical protein
MLKLLLSASAVAAVTLKKGVDDPVAARVTCDNKDQEIFDTVICNSKTCGVNVRPGYF